MGLTHHAGGAHTESSARDGGGEFGHPELRTIYGVRGSEKGLTTTAASIHIAPFCLPPASSRTGRLLVMMPAL
jgi:hypothetical protein